MSDIDSQSNKIPAHAHYTLLLLLLTYVFNYVDRNIINVLIEPIKAEFGVSDTVLGLVSGLLFALFYAVMGLFMGRLSDKYSRSKLMGIYCVSWSALTMLCGAAVTFTHLAFARIGVAVTEAGSAPTSLSMIADLYPPRRRSFAIGVWSIGSHIGALIGMAFGGWVAYQYGWRAAFLAVGLPGILLGLLIYFTVKEPTRGKWDVAQKTEAKQPQEPIWRNVKSLLKNKTYAGICLGCAVAALQAYSVGIWGTSFLMRSHGMTVQAAGLLLGLVAVAGAMLGTVFSGWLTDYLAAKDSGWQIGVPAVGLLIATPAGIAYFLWPADTLFQVGAVAVPTAAIFAVIHGFFTTWWIAPNMAAISQLIPSTNRAFANAFFLLAFTFAGMGIGPIIVGVLSDLFESTYQIEALRYAMVVIVCTAFLSAIILALNIKGYKKALAEKDF
ncbi:MFS transporter [Polynucleobacter sp. 30F-ANTBAC]|jgi:MFS family permease|uniref:spinster family MFS transporter n=1 Tax=Polynucleobacter sp. 30F-ANTBAC TaxID=2689095 RepID=UPI001C0C67F9|nr:MFS transporter [Polynucleobacter sp. 30F-ANTBAC]MBU3600427.1 MFS transporter [Polynucleobacter sp. 30F-ANTBAC]